MRGYWIRIASGAAGVFVVGMAGWFLFSGARSKVEQVIDSAVSLSIPLPFDLVPFKVDGDRLGSLKKLVIHRDSPKEVNWIELEAELNEVEQWAELADCRLSIDDFEDLDENSSFACNRELPRGYVEFGEIRFRGSGESLLLWVPRDVAGELRHADRQRIEMEHVRMYERQVRIVERELRRAADNSAEGSARVAASILEAFGDSIPAAVIVELEAAGIEFDRHVTEIRVQVKSADSAAARVEVGP